MEGGAQRATALDGNCPALLAQAIESVHKAQRDAWKRASSQPGLAELTALPASSLTSNQAVANRVNPLIGSNALHGNAVAHRETGQVKSTTMLSSPATCLGGRGP